MRILLAGPFLTSAFRDMSGLALPGAPAGYAQTPVVPLAAELLRQGHEVHVVTLDPALERVEDLREQRFRLTACPLRAPPRFRTGVRARDLFRVEIAHLVTVMQDSEADVVHAHWTYEYAEAAVRSRRPHLVTMHDVGWDVLRRLPDSYRLMRLAMKYRVMPRIRALTVVAPFMRSKARHYGYFGRVNVIPNGIAVVPKPTRKVDFGAPRFVTVGDSGPLKNVARSIEAFRLIRQQIPAAELHLFGPGLVSTYVGEEAGVRAHGAATHSDLLRFLHDEAAVLIHPSLTESFSVIVLEAKMRGLPVVAGLNSGGVPFVCGEDKGCALVDIRDPGEIARAALALVADRSVYERHSRLAREDAIARFDVAHVADLYVSEYERILGDRAND